MEEKKTSYGKIVATTVAEIAAAGAVAYVVYRLCRSFFTFCDAYREDEFENADLDFNEIDEEASDDSFTFPAEADSEELTYAEADEA